LELPGSSLTQIKSFAERMTEAEPKQVDFHSREIPGNEKEQVSGVGNCG